MAHGPFLHLVCTHCDSCDMLEMLSQFRCDCESTKFQLKSLISTISWDAHISSCIWWLIIILMRHRISSSTTFILKNHNCYMIVRLGFVVGGHGANSSSNNIIYVQVCSDPYQISISSLIRKAWNNVLPS